MEHMSKLKHKMEGKIERFGEEVFVFTSANIFVEIQSHCVVTFGYVDPKKGRFNLRILLFNHVGLICQN